MDGHRAGERGADCEGCRARTTHLTTGAWQRYAEPTAVQCDDTDAGQHDRGSSRRRRGGLLEPFSFGVSVYGFYAVQPYLLELYGDSDSYAIAGLAAALVAGAQIVGGALASVVVRAFRRRTSVLLGATVATVVVLALTGLVHRFGVVLALVAVWGILFSAVAPVRQAFLNGLIPSAQCATLLSSDSLLASAGGVVSSRASARPPTPGATRARTSPVPWCSSSRCRSYSSPGVSTHRRTRPAAPRR
jgi:hypothetical protein